MYWNPLKMSIPYAIERTFNFLSIMHWNPFLSSNQRPSLRWFSNSWAYHQESITWIHFMSIMLWRSLHESISWALCIEIHGISASTRSVCGDFRFSEHHRWESIVLSLKPRPLRGFSIFWALCIEDHYTNPFLWALCSENHSLRSIYEHHHRDSVVFGN